jgi:hypothetical protein
MRSMMKLAGVFTATCLLGAVTAASALAVLEFKETGMGFLVGKALTAQKFATKAGTVECATLEIEKVAASEAELNPEWQLAVVKYSKCTAFGLLAVENFTAMLDFNITGFFRIENEFLIKTTGCTVHVAGFPENQKLKTLEYVNKAGTVEIVANVTKIMSFGEGANCTYALEEAGTYTGKSLVELPGFEISA